MIIETALVELAKAGGTELFISSSESLLKKVKTAKDIKQLFINTGEFFVDYENDADQLFDDMANVLSKENMTKLANELKDEPGYKLKDRLLNSLMGIMKEYEIPHKNMILNIYLDPHMMVLFWIQFLMMWMTKEI